MSSTKIGTYLQSTLTGNEFGSLTKFEMTNNYNIIKIIVVCLKVEISCLAMYHIVINNR